MQENYFTLTFMIRKAQQKRSGEVPIFARITVSGQRTEFNVNRSIDAENWNPAKGIAKGRSKTDIELNKYLSSIRVRMSEIHSRLTQDGEAVNPIVLKNHYLGKIAGPKMLCEVFNGVVAQYKEKLNCGDIYNRENETCTILKRNEQIFSFFASFFLLLFRPLKHHFNAD